MSLKIKQVNIMCYFQTKKNQDEESTMKIPRSSIISMWRSKVIQLFISLKSLTEFF